MIIFTNYNIYLNIYIICYIVICYTIAYFIDFHILKLFLSANMNVYNCHNINIT